RVTDQLLPPHVFHRDCPELLRDGRTPSGVPVFVQLLGGQPGPMAENAAQVAELGALGIDLNFGCPAKTVNRHDGGASLLRNPERVRNVTEAVRQATPRNLPVTAKVRLGFEHKDFVVEIAQAAEAGGAASLTVHARTKMEMYQPPAHWEYIARMREAVHIPVVANGDIWSVEDYRRCRQVSGCLDVALGRGLIAKPDLARQIVCAEQGLPVEPLHWPEIHIILKRFFERLVSESEKLAAARLKQWCKFLVRTYPEAAALFERIKVFHTAADLRKAMDRFIMELEPEGLWPKSQFTPGQFAPIACEPRAF
ncbi:MAG: tRNA dihydrouridine synthase, partial [Bdellovibrionales bacterium]